MSDILSILTKDEKDFIEKYGISPSDIYDARGEIVKVYHDKAKALGCKFVVNSCMYGHRLKDRNGHCIVCHPKYITYQKRETNGGILYIAKYDKENKLYLQEIFDLIPSELNAKNKRFILKNLNQYTKFSKYENSFIWLRDAGVALPTYVADEPLAPLTFSKSSNLFKLFMNDVGLLAAMYGNGIQIKLLKGEAEINFGVVYENAVAQELAAHGYPLYFYNNKKRGEVDFLVEDGDIVTPVEVKSGKEYYRHAALDNLMNVKDYGLIKGYVLCNSNIEADNKVISMPIYMLMFIQKEELPKDSIFELDMSALME